ncbi:MAG: DUF1493 family protein [Zoogloeaceae bacterium]|jgi:hypothetical protein|nr:DUF1493 family protein [Zoogloeaceae bacterium]
MSRSFAENNGTTYSVSETDVAEWLRAELSIPPRKQIDGGTRINWDLGVDGDDGLDLVIEFGKKFNVDISNFPFDDYFGPEAGMTPFSLLVFIWRILKGQPVNDLKPLYVEDFFRMAQDANQRNKDSPSSSSLRGPQARGNPDGLSACFAIPEN